MTVTDDVLRALRARDAGITDIELTTLLGKRHQHINWTTLCRTCRVTGRYSGETSWALERLDMTVNLVTAEGTVEVWERKG